MLSYLGKLPVTAPIDRPHKPIYLAFLFYVIYFITYSKSYDSKRPRVT